MKKPSNKFYHEKPHNNTAYEFSFKTGPLAILPMQTENNNFQSALIWSNNSNSVRFSSS